MIKLKKVSKKEFDNFINIYFNKLEVDIVTICEPPLKRYHDFSISKEPNNCVVASVCMDWPNDEDDDTRKNWEYSIMTRKFKTKKEFKCPNCKSKKKFPHIWGYITVDSLINYICNDCKYKWVVKV